MKFDSIYILNVASFYKVKFLDRLCLEKEICCYFLDDKEEGREKDFFMSGTGVCSISNVSDNKARQLFFYARLLMLVVLNRKSEIVIGGWDRPIYWFLRLLPIKLNISLILESTISESSIGGVKGWLKRYFLQGIERIYASGITHKNLAISLGFTKKIILTNGVGVLEDCYEKNCINSSGGSRYLYVGRLSPEKNLISLINAVKVLNISLDIIGDGPQIELLRKNAAGLDVSFLGHKSRTELFKHFSTTKYRALFLPSYRETWGLVVEEALAFGIPVVVSEGVGCKFELVETMNAGVIINPDSTQSFCDAIEIMESKKYQSYQKSVSEFCLEKKNFDYVKSFK